MTDEMRVVQVQRAPGPSVEFRSTPRGVALSSTSLGVLLEYARPRNVNRIIVQRLLRVTSELRRTGREWWLVRADVTQLLKYTRPSQDAVRRVNEYFTAASALLEAPAPVAGPATAQAPVPAPAPGVVGSSDVPLTMREQLQLGQVRVEQARFITGLITARRLAKELTPQEHRRLAHKAAETALGESIELDARPALAAAPEHPTVPAPVVPTSPPAPRRSLGAVVRGAQIGAAPTAAPKAPEPQVTAPVPSPPDPFHFESTAPPVAESAPTSPRYGMMWILSQYNPPTRATAAELAYLVGFGCTRNKIGIEAARLGFKEGHPWVETKQVQGRHSLREDCTVYYYNREASFSLIEAVLTRPTKDMLRRIRESKHVPLDLFKASPERAPVSS